MFILRNLTVVHVVEWRVSVDAADVDQVLERGAVFDLANLLQPAPAPRQRAEVLLDGVLELLGTRVADRLVVPVEVHHVVRAVGRVPHLPLAPDRAEGLDGLVLVLLHLGLVLVVLERDGVARVDLVPVHRVSVEVLDGHDWLSLAAQFALVAGHDLGHRGAHVAQPHVDAGGVHAGLGGFAHALEQVVERGVERHREGAVHDAPVHVRALVDLQHVALLQDHFVTRVGGLVCRTFVDAHTRRECLACFQFTCIQQNLIRPLDFIAQPIDVNSRFDYFLNVPSGLSVNFSCFPAIINVNIHLNIHFFFFLIQPTSSPSIPCVIIHLMNDWLNSVGILLFDWYRGWKCLVVHGLNVIDKFDLLKWFPVFQNSNLIIFPLPEHRWVVTHFTY